jgi:hypothetical protein
MRRTEPFQAQTGEGSKQGNYAVFSQPEKVSKNDEKLKNWGGGWGMKSNF